MDRNSFITPFIIHYLVTHMTNKIINDSNGKLYKLAYWFLAFNSPFHVFRDAFKVLEYLYGLCLVFILLRTIVKLSFSQYSNHIFLIRFIVLICSIFTSVFLPYDRFSWTLRNVHILVVIYFIRIGKPTEEEFNSFINGYKAAILIDFIWAGIQGIELFRGVYINDWLYNIIGLSDMVGYSINTGMRITGLIWDPYVIGMYCATGFFLFRNKLLKGYIFLLLIGSQSRAGLVAFGVAAIYYFYPFIKKRKYTLWFLFSVAFVSMIVVNKVDLNRGFGEIGTGYVRIEFFKLLPSIMINSSNILLFLFGGSPAATEARFRESGLSIIRLPMFTTDNIESDWAGLTYGQGILGILSYFMMYYYVIKNHKNRILKAICIAILFGGLGYSYDNTIFASFLVYLSSYDICNKNSVLESNQLNSGGIDYDNN